MTQGEREGDLLLRYKMSFVGINKAGIDEVGKGSLFGPVFAGAVILSKSSAMNLIKEGLKDSKKLTPKFRQYLVPLIKKKSISWGIGQSSALEIDTLGIRIATELAMIRAIQKLKKKPKLIIVDGNLSIRLWKGNQISLTKGEDKSPAIAAASVIAKEERDRLIKILAKNFPKYGLETNVGYGTEIHRTAIRKLGASKLHRQTFLSNIITN